MRNFSLLPLILSVFPLCFCTKPIEELLAECEALYESGELKQMQENLRDQFDNDPLEVLRNIKAAGGLDKFKIPIKTVREGGSNSIEHGRRKFVINKKLFLTLKETVYVPGKTYAETVKNHLNYYISGKTNYELLAKALNKCNFENVEMHVFQQLDLDGRVNVLKEKRQELLNAIQTEDSRV